MKIFSASAILFTTACVHAQNVPTALRGSVSVDVAHTKQIYVAKKAKNTKCISDGGLGPASRNKKTPDQICARDFAWDSTHRVAYKCESGARWACCDEAAVGETTQQDMQNLGTCTRYTGEEAADDEEVTGDTEDANDWDLETMFWTSSKGDLSSCTHNCKAQAGNTALPECVSNCKCQNGGCDMPKCTKNCKCQRGGCSMPVCAMQCKCKGGAVGEGCCGPAFSGPCETSATSPAVDIVVEEPALEMNEEADDDEEGTGDGDTEDANDWDLETMFWTSSKGDLSSCTHNCKAQAGNTALPECVSNCKCQNGGCDMPKCTKNCKCQRGGCSMPVCAMQCKCKGGAVGEGCCGPAFSGPCETSATSPAVDIVVEEPALEMNEEADDDEEGTGDGDTEDANDWDLETMFWTTSKGDLSTCTHNCKAQAGNTALPECVSNCKCQNGGCDMPKCTKNCKCQRGGCDMPVCAMQCKCKGGAVGEGCCGPAFSGPCETSATSPAVDIVVEKPALEMN